MNNRLLYHTFIVYPSDETFLFDYEVHVGLKLMFREALAASKIWSSATIPSETRDSHNCLITTTSSALVIDSSPVTRLPMWPPIRTISGIIIPVFNVSHEYNYIIMRRPRNLAYYLLKNAISTFGKYHAAPILFVVINDSDAELRFGNLLTDWLQSTDFVAEGISRDIDLSVHAVDVTNWQAIPNVVHEHFGLSLDDSTLGTTLLLPSSSDVVIHVSHLGVEKEAVLGFAKDCLQGFAPNNKPIHIWFASRPTYQSTPQDILRTLDEKTRGDFLQYGKTVLSVPKINTPPGQFFTQGASRVVESASHVYIEYEGQVYDGVVAFDRTIPLEKYQSNLNATYQERMTIMPGIDLDEVYRQIEAKRDYVASLTKT